MWEVDFTTKFAAALLMPLLFMGFVQAIGHFKQRGGVDADELRKSFDEADINGDGWLNAEELQSVVSLPEGANLEMSVREIQEEIHAGDEITYEIFTEWHARHEAEKWTTTMRMFVLFILYPSISRKIFEAFSCRELSATSSVLRADYSIDCDSNK